MSSSDDNSFTAWVSEAKDKPLVKRTDLKLRAWDDDCVEINITHCGICGSDVHTIDEGWGPIIRPCVSGHEIAGTVAKVGKNVANLKVGDRAGVGPFSGSCYECVTCKEGNPNVCENEFTGTYNGIWPNGDPSYGGYADKWRGDYRWTFKIPDGVTSEHASVLMCGGITTFAPLNRAGVNKDSTVGVLGIGGLGHFAILFANAMGAKVIGLSHSDAKREVAKKLGCHDYINTGNEEDMKKHRKKLTHILSTGFGSDFKWGPYFQLLRANGQFLNVNLPSWNFPEVIPYELIVNQVGIQGSAAGSPSEVEEMLEFVEKHNIQPWVEIYPMEKINEALDDFRDGKPRFRFVLKN